MAIPAVILMSIKSVAKQAIIKKAVNFVLKKDTNKVDLALSFIPGLGGKATRQLRRYQKVCKLSAERYAKNEMILKRLLSGEKINKWTQERAIKQMQIAKELKSKWIKQQVKSAVKRRIPGRKLAMNIKDLGKAIYDHQSWIKIGKKFGTVLSRFGVGEVNSIFNSIDKASSISLTANQWWKHISVNHSYLAPIVNSSGGSKMRYARRYKEKYQEQLFDREFWFAVSSPQTGNFEQGLHSYEPVNKHYTLPIRSAFGYVKTYTYKDAGQLGLDRVISIVCMGNMDFGANIFADLRNPYQEDMWIYASADPNYVISNQQFANIRREVNKERKLNK